MSNSQSKSLEDKYIKLSERDERISFLQGCVKKNQTLKFEFVRDMLHLTLDNQEKAMLIKVCNGSDVVALENFLHEVFSKENQDLVAPAIYESVERTPGVLSHRFTQSLPLDLQPQRVVYTLLLHPSHFGGQNLLKAIDMMPGIDELSSTFHSLMFQQSVILDCQTPIMSKIAKSYIDRIESPEIFEERVLINLIPYLAKFDPNELERFVSRDKLSAHWLSFTKATLEKPIQTDPGSFLKSIDRTENESDLLTLFHLWPQPWHRSDIEKDLVVHLFDGVQRNKAMPASHFRNFVVGVQPEMIVESLSEIEPNEDFIKVLELTSDYIPKPLPETVVEKVREYVGKCKNPADAFANLPTTIQSNTKLEKTKYDLKAFQEEAKQVFAAINKGDQKKLESFKFARVKDQRDPENDREVFFQIAFNQKVGFKTGENNFWTKLTQTWQNPEIKNLTSLSQEARKQPGIHQLAYLKTLSRFKDSDEAAMKMLDFIRSESQDELEAIIQSLAAIGSERALQELVLMITKSNMTANLQILACEQLKQLNVKSVQKEIRRAISDLTVDVDSDDVRSEVRDNLKLLLLPEDGEKVEEKAAKQASGFTGTKNLDTSLSKKIPNYSRISSEVKSALRTAEFFHSSILVSTNVDTIDFTPLIDMQYKALELIFREMFEGPTMVLIKHGVLQRRLDLIGYARPLPPKMDQFEEFIGSLPIIDTVPFFSKFKLRKMLRALCQYRPGKRFTLDGLKAFGLFFLCFSRKECRYGLENLFPLPYKTDEELFEFVKCLHIFQDFRNRAAHEGFPPAARNNIDGIWQSTSEILQHVYLIRDFIDAQGERKKSKKQVA